MDISVIVCTHNPRKDYLSKALLSLRNQLLPFEFWELIFVDNASNQPLDSQIELSWHPKSHFIREEKLGLTHARLRGIQESKGDLVVFVDDDNVLEPNYLEIVHKIGRENLVLGAWGGQTLPWFEEKPPEWSKHCWEYLGIREFNTDQITKTANMAATPIGAGMCVRRSVAEAYASRTSKNQHSLKLGRTGNKLLGHEDVDLAYTAFDLGLEVGVFKDLKLTHLMPSSRLEKEYLFKLAEGTGYSEIWMEFNRGTLPSLMSWQRRLRMALPWVTNPKSWFSHPNVRKFCQASTKGRITAMKEILHREIMSKKQNLQS